MAKKVAASQALLNMSKADLAKLDRTVTDLEDAAADASAAVARAYKDKIKKRGIHLDAYKLARKLNSLGSPAKTQAFLVDFDKLRELYGWDNQKNLFEEDKTAVQKKAESKAVAVVPKAKANGNGHTAPKPGKKAEKAKAKAAELQATSGKRVARQTEKKIARRGAALFSESDDGDEATGPLN